MSFKKKKIERQEQETARLRAEAEEAQRQDLLRRFPWLGMDPATLPPGVTTTGFGVPIRPGFVHLPPKQETDQGVIEEIEQDPPSPGSPPPLLSPPYPPSLHPLPSSPSQESQEDEGSHIVLEKNTGDNRDLKNSSLVNTPNTPKPKTAKKKPKTKTTG